MSDHPLQTPTAPAILAGAYARPHFRWDELRCRGCDGSCPHSRQGRSLVHVADHALDRLQAMRELIGRPLAITSASRCPLHNARVGGAPLSQHRATWALPSTAFDIVIGTLPRERLVEAAEAVGFGGIGMTYRSFVHVDDRGRRARW